MFTDVSEKYTASIVRLFAVSAACFLPLPCFVYSPTLRMDAIISYETYLGILYPEYCLLFYSCVCFRNEDDYAEQTFDK
jgi:hypothetical protein